MLYKPTLKNSKKKTNALAYIFEAGSWQI